MKKEKASIAVEAATKLASAVRQPVQARSRDRVERVLGTTEALIQAYPMQEITIALISEGSGVGRPTIYQFFPTVQSIFHTLGLRYLDELYADMSGSAAARGAATWQETSDIIVDITADFYRRRPAACTLFLGDGSLHGLRVIDHDFDKRFVESIRDLFGTKLDVVAEKGADPIEIFITIGISVLSLSVYHSGRVSDYYREQAKIAVRSYLGSTRN